LVNTAVAVVVVAVAVVTEWLIAVAGSSWSEVASRNGSGGAIKTVGYGGRESSSRIGWLE